MDTKLSLPQISSPLVYISPFFSEREYLQVCNSMRTLDLESSYYKFNGQILKNKRKVWWTGPIPYTYSATTLYPKYHPIISELMKSFNSNSCLVNYYNEKSALSWHSDDESIIDDSKPIISISLLSGREFGIRSNRKPHFETTLTLEPNSLLIMPENMQSHYRHCVYPPKTTSERFNLTFRTVVDR